MNFLADERCDHSIVRALWLAGHDVLAISEQSQDERILVTEDKDFGRLVFASSRPSIGVVFVRFPATARARLANEITELVSRFGETLRTIFVSSSPAERV